MLNPTSNPKMILACNANKTIASLTDTDKGPSAQLKPFFRCFVTDVRAVHTEGAALMPGAPEVEQQLPIGLKGKWSRMDDAKCRPTCASSGREGPLLPEWKLLSQVRPQRLQYLVDNPDPKLLSKGSNAKRSGPVNTHTAYLLSADKPTQSPAVVMRSSTRQTETLVASPNNFYVPETGTLLGTSSESGSKCFGPLLVAELLRRATRRTHAFSTAKRQGRIQ